jgi:hypothetical protein
MNTLDDIKVLIDQRIESSKKKRTEIDRMSKALSRQAEAPSKETGKFFQKLGEWKQLGNEIDFLRSIRDLLKDHYNGEEKPKTIGELVLSNIKRELSRPDFVIPEGKYKLRKSSELTPEELEDYMDNLLN